MKTARCPVCGKGEVAEEVIPRYDTRLGGVPVLVDNARIGRCSACGETYISAKEIERWRAIQRLQLQEAKHVPSAGEVTRIRESLGLTVSDFATLVGVSRQSVHAWERQGGGMAFGPASNLISLLRAEVEGKLSGVCLALVEAAKSRGQEVRSAEKSPFCDTPAKQYTI